MRIPARTLLSGSVFVFAAMLLVGCGGSQPAADPDAMAEAPSDIPDDPIDDTPPAVRDDTPVYVDPNQEYEQTLQAVLFEFNKYRITGDAKPQLEGIADLLNDHPSWKILIEGHCDERGTNEYNLALGENRALSTKRYLNSLGVPESRFQTISYGEERPVSFGHDEESWTMNRRAEFRVEAPRP